MEIVFQLFLCVFMGTMNCLIFAYYTDDEPGIGNFLIAVSPWFGNFYAAKYKNSITGILYALFRVLEFPALLLWVSFMKTESYHIGCQIVIIVAFTSCILRSIHVGLALRDCWASNCIIILAEMIPVLEGIYIVGILPYTLQNFPL